MCPRARSSLARVSADTLIFIPAFNEEESVADVVRAVRAELPDADILVIDDGSSDRTAAVSREAGAIVASLPFNRGLGAALQTGYLYAREHGYSFCAHLDSDGQHRPEDLHKLLDAVRSGRADLALGSRYKLPDAKRMAEAYEPTLLRRIGTELFRRLLSFTTRHHFTDTTSGLRAANRTVIELFASYYGADYPELESLQRVVRCGLRLEEIPVVMLPRAAGRSKFNPFNSAFFVFKGLLVVGVGAARRHAPVEAADGE